MKTHILALAFAFIGLFAFTPANTAKAQNPTQDIPIVGSFLGGTFEGTLDVNRFITRSGQIFAVGTLTGTLTDALGNVIGTVTNVPIQLPVSNINGTCEILDLELGPLDLNLLGLVVHLDRINLEITAESGPGNLLGNLLCAVAGLLDNSASPSALVRLLNQILGALG